MIIGVSTACLYPMDTAESLEQLCQHGIRNFEVFFNTFSEFEEEYLQRLQTIKEKYQAQIVSVHPFTSEMESLLFFSDYPQRQKDGLQLYEKYFAKTRQLGAKYFIFHGGKEHFIHREEEYFARYSLLLERAKRQGITLLHENVVRTKSRDLDFLVRLSKALPEARFVLDVKQAIRSDVSPIEFMKKLGPAVEHIHFSDHNDAQDCLPVGKGNMDLNNFFHKMLLNTNCHSVILELYRSSFKNVENLVESCQIMCKKIKENLQNLDN